MSGWVAYWNGRFVADDRIRIPLDDRGFLLGDAGYEVTRTYRHVPFHLDWHLDRLWKSLSYLGLHPGLTRGEAERITHEVLARNRPRLRPHDDVWLTHRVTRGPGAPLFGGLPPGPPTVLITCRPIPFARFAHFYEQGVELRVPRLRLPTHGGVAPHVKTHSRLPLALGALDVARLGSDVIPLFADVDGRITESSSSNVFFVFTNELVTPPDDAVLQGITRQVVLGLCDELGMKVTRRLVHLRELGEIDEAFITATSYGVLPVRQVEDRSLRPVPGVRTQRLTAALSRHVGVDIVAQSLAHVS